MKRILKSAAMVSVVACICTGCYVEDRTPNTTIVKPPDNNTTIVKPPDNNTTIINPPATGGEGSTTTTTTGR